MKIIPLKYFNKYKSVKISRGLEGISLMDNDLIEFYDITHYPVFDLFKKQIVKSNLSSFRNVCIGNMRKKYTPAISINTFKSRMSRLDVENMIMVNSGYPRVITKHIHYGIQHLSTIFGKENLYDD